MARVRLGTTVFGLLLAVGGSLPLWCGSSHALTRSQALVNIAPYVLSPYTVTAANVYPTNTLCYTSTMREKLDVGTYYGAPYSYGGVKKYTAIPVELAANKGAGNSKALYDAKPDCVAAHITGIDCSGLVCRAWEVYRPNTTGLASSEYSLEINDVGTVAEADIFDYLGHHVVIFNSWDTFLGSFHLTEASGGEGRCVQRGNVDLIALMGNGYAPYVSVKLKDDPASQIAYFEVAGDGARAVVKWATLMEDRTASFAVRRAANPAEPPEPLSPDIAAHGSATTGGEYEFVDESPGSLDVVYELIETETSGRVITHGKRSLRDALAQQGQEVPR